MDKKERKFKISIIDCIVVLVIVAAVAVAAVVLKPRLFGSGNVAQAETEIITIELAKQKEYMLDNIVEGDMVYDAVGNTDYGRLVSYDVKPATETVVSEMDGSVKTVEIPERYDIYIRVEASANSTAEVGRLATVYSKNFKASGYVVGVERELAANEAAVETVEKKGAVQ